MTLSAFRHCAAAFAIALLTAGSPVASVAQESEQDWIPDAVDLPDDREVLVDRAIGSSTRIFSFATAADGEALIDGWADALQEAGYVIAERSETMPNRQLEFSGPGIGNAKIAVQPQTEGARNVIQFDASLSD